MKLIAMCSVLYRSIQYRAGDALPADNGVMVNAWIDAGSAKWVEDEEPKKAAKAKAKTATPGRTGKSNDGDKDALAGKLPEGRKK